MKKLAKKATLKSEQYEEKTRINKQPYVRVLPNGLQIALARDALTVLNHPKAIHWKVNEDGSIQLISATTRSAANEVSYMISYTRTGRAGIITIPSHHRSRLIPGRYRVVAWSVNPPPGRKPGEWLIFKPTDRLFDSVVNDLDKFPKAWEYQDFIKS